MGTYKACEIPEELFYDVARDVWVRWEEDGTATLGMTDTAQARLGRLVNVKFKAVGKALRLGQPVAVLESAKWVGPFPTPLSGVLIGVNQAFDGDILLLNKDPYGAGWLARLRPTNADQERPGLLTGPAAFEAYRRKIDELGIHCIRCAD